MTMKGRYLIGAAAGMLVGALLMLVGGSWVASAQGSQPNVSNTLVSCDPSQQVIVRHTVVNRELQVATQCVNTPGLTPVGYVDDGYISAARPMRVVRTASAP